MSHLIDAFSSQAHYVDHLRPVWEALPARIKGRFWRPTPSDPWGDDDVSSRQDTTRLTLVAGFRDGKAMHPAPLIYLEHGVGQTYRGDPNSAHQGSFPGGPGLERVRLFLCPSDRVAGRWRSTYPRTSAVVVGCPKLDRYHAGTIGLRRAVPIMQGDYESRQEGAAIMHGPKRQAPPQPWVRHGPTVAITFHWDNPFCEETRSAWRHYQSALPALAADPHWTLLGHAHPRLWTILQPAWQALQVEATPNLNEVLDRADLLVVDNSSAAYEAASIGTPVVVCSAPWYRRDVTHGLRFWDAIPGIHVEEPEELAPTIAQALADPVPVQLLGAAAASKAYAFTDGQAAERAASAVMELFAHWVRAG